VLNLEDQVSVSILLAVDDLDGNNNNNLKAAASPNKTHHYYTNSFPF
jgi:hypothetical protein